jgi:hypothetical protein
MVIGLKQGALQIASTNAVTVQKGINIPILLAHYVLLEHRKLRIEWNLKGSDDGAQHSRWICGLCPSSGVLNK